MQSLFYFHGHHKSAADNKRGVNYPCQDKFKIKHRSRDISFAEGISVIMNNGKNRLAEYDIHIFSHMKVSLKFRLVDSFASKDKIRQNEGYASYSCRMT